MTLNTQLRETLKTANQKGHTYIVAFSKEKKIEDILLIEPLSRRDLSQKTPAIVRGNGFGVVFGKISDFSISYMETFLKKCAELPNLKFETY